MTVISQRAPAKINLFLRVTSRRPDGYHELETLFQRIELADRLTFERAEGSSLELDCRDVAVSPIDAGAKENLVNRAHQALIEECGDRVAGVRVMLEKRIPVGGGLGGGSSDAAAALVGLDRLFDLGLDAATLHRIALQLGADVPFFLGSPCAVGRGIGEELTSFDHASQFRVVLAFPERGVFTPVAFARYDALGAAPSDANIERVLDALKKKDLSAVLENLHNDLERPVFHLDPKIGHLRKQLETLAKRPVRMTGSGSSLFTLAETDDDARDIARRWSKIETIQHRVTRFSL